MGTEPVSTHGGKGANLVRLREAGFDVPAFIVIPTSEYDAFVADHQLDDVISRALDLDADAAAERIRDAFRQPLLEAQRDSLTALLTPLLDQPVAVRSSATAEDLPDASFAGQQDTFLDVRGLDAILDAVIECWSSLWTARAISYRERGGIDHDAVSLAVVVQEMVPADASGVLFTADPLTGHRGHTSIDAVAGLGEALVSGQVSPAHWTLETDTGRVLQQGDPDVLTDTHLLALVDLGRRAAGEFGSPQDIEWCRVGDRLRLVQSRPITSLYPLPEPTAPGELWFSVGAFQGMLRPFTPLGQDAILGFYAGASTFAGARVDRRTPTYVHVAGERLWIRVDRLLATTAGRRRLPMILRGVDPNAARVTERLVAAGEFGDSRTVTSALPWRGLSRLARVLGPRLPATARTLARPDGARPRLDVAIDHALRAWQHDLDRAGAAASAATRLAARVTAVDDLCTGFFPRLGPDLVTVMPPALASTILLRHLADGSGLGNGRALGLRALRSLPGNVTAEMDLALYDVACLIRDDPSSLAAVRDQDAADAAAAYLTGSLPPVAQAAVAEFLNRYGMRGVAEIDLGAPRWREDPTAVFRTLATYVSLEGDDAPDVIHRRGSHEAQDAIDTIVDAYGPRSPAAVRTRIAGRRVRALFGVRETPKFTIIRAFGLAREALLASGADLVAAGLLDAPTDVVFLHLDELRYAFDHPDLRGLVARRRERYEREMRRARIPVVLAGDGRAFYDAGDIPDVTDDTAGPDLVGMGVSPGTVEGVVRIVHDPATSELQPGEILVCRGTDPAWTPLFLTAAGLITEVGGLMTHGSVVAREYGLPAVVGVTDATVRLADGQRVRVDGSAGMITVADTDG
ncbi:MAG: PEP/pyruvate-binding domain-containing protein [Mobilicoccus sp.]|nr:PEP/pyruvate-binding domain-containing protein [Mobilicoccus sp.]